MIEYEHIDYEWSGVSISLVSDMVVRKAANAGHESFEKIRALCNHFMRYPDPMVVPIYNFELIKTPKTAFDFYTYSYDMKRLGKLSRTEKDIINRADWHPVGIWKSDLILSNALDNHPKLMRFLKRIVEEGRYRDLHGGNVLKNEQEEFCLIDIEGFDRGGVPLSDPCYDWVSK